MPIDIREIDAEVEVVPDPPSEGAGPREPRPADRRDVDEVLRRLEQALRKMLRQGTGS